MAPRKKKEVKPEHNRIFAPTDPVHEDQYADTDKGGSDKGESTQNQAEIDEEQTAAKPKAKTKSPKVPKTPEELAADEARKARTMAATEAVSAPFGHLWRKPCVLTSLTYRINSS